MSKVTSATHFDAVRGKIPSEHDLALWTQGSYITFLRFCEIFIRDGKLSVTRDRWRECEQFLVTADHPFNEYLYRINAFTFDKDASEKKFFFKLMNFMKRVLEYLKKNPSLIGDDLKAVMESNPKFSWALHQLKVVDTASGVPMVVPDDKPPTSDLQPIFSGVAGAELQLQEAAIKVTNLLHRLATSVTDKELKEMPVKDRLVAIGRLSFIFSLSKSLKPNKNVFTQININASKREDLEDMLLQYNKHE